MSSDNQRESEETPMEQQSGDSGSKTTDSPEGGESLKCHVSDAKESQQTESSNKQEGQCEESRTESNTAQDDATTDGKMEVSGEKQDSTVNSNGSVVGGGGGAEANQESEIAPSSNKGEIVDLKVMYNKKKYDVRLGVECTVAELKTEIQTATGVPPAMQKLMFKGLMKDDKTLLELKVTSGAKLMLIGSTPKAVLEVTKPVVVGASADKEEKASTSKEPLCKQKMHKKVLDKGKPEDAMIGIKNQNEALPNVPVSGMLNKAGGKVRLTFKLELDQLWIGTKERTEKINMNSIKNVLSEPIEGHEDYHIMAIQLGPTEASRYWIYWVPTQYAKAIKDTILGKWVYF